jgi:cellulose synthase (UDP-forming)
LASSTRRASIILPLWILCTAWMWLWWLQPERSNFGWLFIPLTMALFYEFALLPSIFLYFVMKAKNPPRRIAPKNKKVAVISLCVPSKESIDIVEKQLKAMSEITYPHDSWILDEGNSKQIKILAKKYGVKHFSRKGIEKYNQSIPPFQQKTKAGNVNAWLDRVKRRKYEFFVQFDIDHLAKPNYLNKTLGYFRDEKVAWVQAPSVYKNRTHWTSRGAAEQELVLQGPLQMGFYGHSETPFIIGSHCTYRTSAINEINGFQPTRAEDHLDTVMLASKGYKGVFLPEIIAEGDGPDTLNTYLAQQFAWAYSMFQVLLYHTPKLLKTMPLRAKWQFLFAQTWYPLWALSYFVMFICPVISLLTNREVANMQKPDLLVHFVPMFICSFLVWWAARPIMQPQSVNLSWRGMILHAVRWPIILRAVLSAAFKIKKPYMITPKGTFSNLAPSVKLYQPFIILGLVNATAVVVATLIYKEKTLVSQTVFALTNALFMAIICLVDADIRLRQFKPSRKELVATWLKPVTAIAVLLVVTANALIISPLISDYHAEALPVDGSKQAHTNSSVTTKASLLKEIGSIPAGSTIAFPSTGMYDPHSADSSSSYIQHDFVDWRDSKAFAQKTLSALKNNNVPLITLEPRGEADGNKLLTDILQGAYDTQLDQITEVIMATKHPIYIRFAHEMELYELYPWGDQDPKLFTSAYRYVVEYSRAKGAENVRWVWSPAGNHGAEAYYPGDDVVDVVGTTVLYDKYWYGTHYPSFAEIAESRHWLAGFHKPVWIVEFGAGGADPVFQRALVQDALASYRALGYDALLYLNIIDSNITGPDYRLSSDDLLPMFTDRKIPTHKNDTEQTCQLSSDQTIIFRAISFSRTQNSTSPLAKFCKPQ